MRAALATPMEIIEKKAASDAGVSVTIRHDRRQRVKAASILASPAGEGWPYPRRDVCGRAPANWCGHAAHFVPSRRCAVSDSRRPSTKGCVRLHVKRGPNRAFMIEFAYFKEGSLGSELPGAAWKQRRQGSGQGYDHPTKWSRASGMATVLIANVSPPA